MPDVLEEPRLVLTRKPHICFGCEEVFPAKTQMERQVNVDSGYDKPYSIYICLACRKHWNEPFYNEYGSEELYQGELKTFCIEQAQRGCKECKEEVKQECSKK